jgi:hypothetical protein
MTTEWVISEATERVKLSGGKGEITFTVTNPGSRIDRVVFEVAPGDGADISWFPPLDEPQRMVAGQASTTYLVKIAVPAGAPAGSYWMQGRAYSADTAPEEGSRLSKRITFDVVPAVVPRKRWWPYAVAAALVVVVLAVLGFVVVGGGKGKQANDCIAGYVWREAVPNDHVCVTQATHDQAQLDNAQATARREPNGGPYGPDTCKQGFVWRGATDTDHVCVTGDVRTQTAQDNQLAATRRKA